MKKIIVFFICILLSGCVAQDDLSKRLDNVFASEQSTERIRRNSYSRYIDYYLPSGTGELEGDMLSSRFSYNSSNFVMDINISGIINEHYYKDQGMTDEGFFDPSRLIYERNSTFVDADGVSREYSYRVYSYDRQYLTYFRSRELLFYGYASLSDLVDMTSRILMIAKSAAIRHNEVISAYSSKTEVDYEKKQVNLFETIMPVNGNVNDFMIDGRESGDSQ
ncbi:MAG: hypothetical protein K5648_08770 [Erysipelotrichaceae bacterium]|nr:hypothetical protein [Erysipelotrichaceae bacterium]